MTKYRTIDCITVLSAFALSVTATAHAASYTVTDLGTLGGAPVAVLAATLRLGGLVLAGVSYAAGKDSNQYVAG